MSAKRLECLAGLLVGFGASVIHLYRHCERGAFMWRTRQSSGGQRYSVPTPQVCGSPRVYVPDGTDARDDGKKCAQVCGLPRRCATYVARLAMTGKNAHRFVDWWPRHGQCSPHLHKGAECRTGKGRCATYVARLTIVVAGGKARKAGQVRAGALVGKMS